MNRSIHKPGRQREWEQRWFPGQDPITIWKNTTNPNSLRITHEAKAFLTQNTELAVYKFDIPDLTNFHLIQLDHLFRSPYFLRNRKVIYLFDEQDSIMLSLHGNDLPQYLDNLANG